MYVGVEYVQIISPVMKDAYVNNAISYLSVSHYLAITQRDAVIKVQSHHTNKLATY